MISQQELKDCLHYDDLTGIFTRVKASGGMSVGDVAGYIGVAGYVRMKVLCKSRSAHRMAWLYVHGVHPKGEVDHINGIKSDNRMINLRDVSCKVNSQNRKTRDDCGSGFLGVSKEKGARKYRVRIHLNGKEVCLGRFDKLSDAVKARLDADDKNGFHPNHGAR